MKLTKIKEIKGTIELKTGLHIGAGDMEMRIGGIDNAVIKHPHTQEPYIPGSSIKGKVRALLETRSGLMEYTKGAPVRLENLDNKDKPLKGALEKECRRILKLFGGGADESKERLAQKIGPTRVSFADCPLDREWLENTRQDHLPLVEVKSENAINRIKGVAENPRFTERVPAGAKFRFTITLKEMAGDAGDGLEKLLLEGLRLLELDALGGSGSRGYGRIGFRFDSTGDPELDQSIQGFSEIDPFPSMQA